MIGIKSNPNCWKSSTKGFIDSYTSKLGMCNSTRRLIFSEFKSKLFRVACFPIAGQEERRSWVPGCCLHCQMLNFFQNDTVSLVMQMVKLHQFENENDYISWHEIGWLVRNEHHTQCSVNTCKRLDIS